jgi:hypothetical protein
MQETLLKPGKTFNLPGYISIRNDRINKHKGGVATFIKTGTNYSVLQLPASLECVGLKILSGKQELNIINLYVAPTETVDTTVLCNLFKLNNTIITGDLNGHNPLWGSKNININGRLIEDLMTSSDQAMEDTMEDASNLTATNTTDHAQEGAVSLFWLLTRSEVKGIYHRPRLLAARKVRK